MSEPNGEGQCKGYAGDPGASAPRCESYAGHPGSHFIRSPRLDAARGGEPTCHLCNQPITTRSDDPATHIGCCLADSAEGCCHADAARAGEGLDVAALRKGLRKAITDLPQPTLGLRGGVDRGAVIDAIDREYAALHPDTEEEGER